MARLFKTPIDLGQLELLNARIQNVTVFPASPVAGQIVYRSDLGKLHIYNGTSWVVIGSLEANSVGTTELANGAVTSEKIANGTIVNEDISATAAIALSKLATDPLARANHTGTQTASTISDFDTQVRTSRLDQMAAPTADVSLNSRKITNLADPANAQDAATKAYVDAAAVGIDWKPSVRAATTGNITLSGAQTIDGVSVVAGNRVLVKNQSVGSENGIYVVGNDAWSRASDADTNTEVTAGLAVFVEEGTANADSGWVLTTNGTITVGTTALTFTQFTGLGQIVAGDGLTQTGNTLDVGGTASRITVTANAVDIAADYVGQTSITTLGTVTTGTWNGTAIAVANGGTGGTTVAEAKTNLGFVSRFAVTIGDNTATSIPVTHNLGTRDVTVQVHDAATYDVVECDVTMTSTSVVTLGFAVAPATNSLRVVVIG